MIGKLSYGVAGGGWFPHGLLGGEAIDGDTHGDEPFFLVPGCLELVEQDGPQGWCDGVGLLSMKFCRCQGYEAQQEECFGVMHSLAVECFKYTKETRPRGRGRVIW